MHDLIAAVKFTCLFFVFAYGAVVFVQGAIHGRAVSQTQNFLFSFAAAGFITLQWLL